jgi:hypothetical protein
VRFLFIALLFPLSSLASVDIAFLEVPNRQGQPRILEAGGRYAHIAISYQKQWLHSHPQRGVEIVSKEILQQTGRVAAIVTLTNDSEPSPSAVKPILGKPYDLAYSWSDESFYCSELVGKLLRVPPEPMNFEPSLWPPQYRTLRGKPGLSPDDLFRLLQRRAHRIQRRI